MSFKRLATAAETIVTRVVATMTLFVTSDDTELTAMACASPGDVITKDDVFDVMEEDLAAADMVLWVGISFEQSASTSYFRRVSISPRADAKMLHQMHSALCQT